jgi:hypothetical protein
MAAGITPPRAVAAPVGRRTRIFARPEESKMVRGVDGRSLVGAAGQWLLVAFVALSLGPAARAAADVETRDFSVYVDAKKAGDVHMTINCQDDGAIAVSCDTDVRVGGVIALYKYSYRGRELWKDGRLQRFESKCDDNGKQFAVSVASAADGLHVRVNDTEHKASADAWLSSYWAQPDARLNDHVVPIVDADCGRDLEAKVQFVGPEKYGPDGQEQIVQHVRLTGKGVGVDLWYDDAKRLVREEWMEDDHRTVVELKGVRR